jgi:hypothetical protein
MVVIIRSFAMPFQALPILGSAVSEEEGIGLAEAEELLTASQRTSCKFTS